ncbi:MAG: gluconokinase [Myxococcales bacterium]
MSPLVSRVVVRQLERPIVVMGVAGAGKSAVGAELARRLGRDFIEGDDHHPPENLDKMAAGLALTDEDRWPWLERLADLLERQQRAGRPAVLSCSALRRCYRDRLRRAMPVFFVHLVATAELLDARLAARADHFMPRSLLPSQLATLEPLEPDEPGVVLDASKPLPDVVDQALQALG